MEDTGKIIYFLETKDTISAQKAGINPPHGETKLGIWEKEDVFNIIDEPVAPAKMRSENRGSIIVLTEEGKEEAIAKGIDYVVAAQRGKVVIVDTKVHVPHNNEEMVK